MATVFFSWQSDRNATCGRNFLERALREAVKQLNRDLELISAGRELSVDRDTQGVAGSPHIVDTILQKIDACRVFVADLTFVGQRSGGKATPNPNVLIEYGWALKSKGTGAFIGVMNVAHGEPGESNLPFDLRHLRHPLTYNLPDGATDDQRRAEKEKLVPHLKSAIKAILASTGETAEGGRTTFEPRAAVDGRGRLVRPEDPWGVIEDRWRQTVRAVRLAPGPVLWLRMYPKFVPDGGPLSLSTAQMMDMVRNTTKGLSIDPLVVGSAQDFFRRSDGAGICVCGEGPEQTMSLAVVLENGEFWAADRFMAEEDPVDVRIFPESQYFELMEKCISVYRKSLQLDLPWVWEAGVEGLENKRLLPWTPRNAFSAKPTGVSLKDVVVKRGEIHSADARPQDVLRPFVEAFYDAFHSKPQGAVFD